MKKDLSILDEVNLLRSRVNAALSRESPVLSGTPTIDDPSLAVLLAGDLGSEDIGGETSDVSSETPVGSFMPPSFSVYETFDNPMQVHKVQVVPPDGSSAMDRDVVAVSAATGPVYCKVTLDEAGAYASEITTSGNLTESDDGKMVWLVKLADLTDGAVEPYHVGSIVVGDVRPDGVSLQDKYREELGPRPVHELFSFHDTGYVMDGGIPAAPTGAMYHVLLRDTTGPSGPVLRYIPATALGGGGPTGPTSPLSLLVDLRYNVTGHRIEKKSVQWDFENNFIGPVGDWTVIEGGVATPLADEL